MNKKIFSENFRKNLDALKEKGRNVKEILDFKIEDFPLIKTFSGDYTLLYKFKERSLYLNSKYDPLKEAQNILKEVKLKDNILVLGIGLGYQVKELKRYIPPKKIFIWEEDPKFIFLSLNLHDFSKEIEEERIIFIFNKDEEALKELKKDEFSIVTHPVIYKNFNSLYDSFLREVFLKKKKRKVKRNILLVNLFPYEAYQEMIFSLGEVFSYMGHRVKTLGKKEEEIRSEIINFVPDFIVSITFDIFLNEVSRSLKIPYFCWEIDKIMNEEIFEEKNFSPYRYIFCVYLDDIERFKNKGYRHVYYLPFVPNCSSLERLEYDDYKKYRHEICFVGSLMKNIGNPYPQLKREFLKKIEDKDEKAKQGVNFIFSILEEALEKQEEYNKRNIYLLPSLIQDLEEKFSIDLSKILGMKKNKLINILAKEACFRQRYNTLKALNGFRVTVYGNRDWEEISLRNIDFRGRLEFSKEAPKVFYLSKINLNLTRIYALDGITDRAYNILANNGFLILNDSLVVERQFHKGREVVTFHDFKELRDLCSYYLKHESERKKIAQRGYERVLKEHTMNKRAEFMLEKLNE